MFEVLSYSHTGVGAIPKPLAERLKSNLLNKVFQAKCDCGLGLSACEESRRHLRRRAGAAPLCSLQHPSAHTPCSSQCCSACTDTQNLTTASPHSQLALPCASSCVQLLACLISLPHLSTLHLSPMNSIFSISVCFSDLSRSLF